MKNHQFSKRKVFIIPLLLQNEQHRPLKIFKKPQQKKQKRKNSRIPSCSQNEQYQSSIHLSQFPRKEWKSMKQAKANPKEIPSPLEERQSRNRFPMMYPGQYRPTRRMFPVFWKYEEAQQYRVFGRLSVRVNTRQCPPFVRPVYRRCLPNKSLYTVGALFVSPSPPSPREWYA